MSKIFSVKIIAVLKNQNILRQIYEFDLKDKIQRNVFYKLKMINLGVIPILENSSIIVGYYEINAKRENPPSFFTINLLYIDLLKRITKVENILNEKYCDIDPSFGLHDYTITVEIRN